MTQFEIFEIYKFDSRQFLIFCNRQLTVLDIRILLALVFFFNFDAHVLCHFQRFSGLASIKTIPK